MEFIDTVLLFKNLNSDQAMMLFNTVKYSLYAMIIVGVTGFFLDDDPK